MTALSKILPAGAKLDEHTGCYHWRKRGGHPDATIRGLRKRAEVYGFVPADRSSTGSPDGSVVGSGAVYRAPDGSVLEVSQSYGVTAADNHFSAVLTPGPGTPEALRWRLERAGFSVVRITRRFSALSWQASVAFVPGQMTEAGPACPRCSLVTWHVDDPNRVTIINTDSGREQFAGCYDLPPAPGTRKEVSRG